jgi:hypothetical protein
MAMIADLLNPPLDPSSPFDAALLAEELADWEVDVLVRMRVGWDALEVEDDAVDDDAVSVEMEEEAAVSVDEEDEAEVVEDTVDVEEELDDSIDELVDDGITMEASRENISRGPLAESRDGGKRTRRRDRGD